MVRMDLCYIVAQAEANYLSSYRSTVMMCISNALGTQTV